MRAWNITPDKPISLTLASDARLGPTSYTNDQIWELNFGNSEPPALSLQTTFGLRARICRIFPRFILAGQAVNDPGHFSRPVTIHNYYPNYVRVSFKPFSSINVQIEYWVPGSQVIAGRIKIRNTSHDKCTFELEWSELLIPSPDGIRMALNGIGLTSILSGRTSNLCPVFFLTGGVQAGKSPYPSLNLAYDLPPHGEEEARWANASLSDMDSSFNLAREVIKKNWDAEFARIDRINTQQLEITTGNQDWNTAFSLSQIIASQLILHPTEICQHPSFVYSRNPDQGFSTLVDGSDYNHLWNGQTAFDAYYLTNFLLPSSPDTLKGIVENFLAAQTSEGEIDWKVGLGGQRSQLLSTPLLANLVWKYYVYTGDITYLQSVFPRLFKFFQSWFSHSHDRDRDSFPEWDQTVQTGFDEHPYFSFHSTWSSGLDISKVESPDLVAYLYREGRFLLSMARIHKDSHAIHQLDLKINRLRQMSEETWSDQSACYHYRDRDSHLTTSGMILGTLKGSGVIEIHQEFPQPIRPALLIKSKGERTQPIQVYIHGTTPNGAHRVDHILAHRIRWHLGSGFITSEYIYQSIEQIEISGILEDVEIIVRSIDLTGIDQTLLLPLWAGMLSEEKAKILANLSILNKKLFLAPYGLRSIAVGLEGTDLPEEYFALHLPYLSLILEGLVEYGFYKQAADIYTRLMKAVLHPLNSEMRFHQFYHSETGQPMGGINLLTSLVPIEVFLKILGINIISPTRVEIKTGNPFQWPVSIKYRGLTVLHQEKKTLVIFPDGQNITVQNDQPRTICLENINQTTAQSMPGAIAE